MDARFCGSAFWDSNGTQNGTGPDFTVCFRDTILVWIPCGWILFFTPFYFAFIERSKSFCHTWLNVTKTTLTIALMAIMLMDIIFRVKDYSAGNSRYPAYILAPFMLLVALGTSVVLIELGRRRGVQSSGVLFFYWLLHFVSSALLLQSRIRIFISHVEADEFNGDANVVAVYHLVFSSLFTLLVFVQTILAGFFCRWA